MPQPISRHKSETIALVAMGANDSDDPHQLVGRLEAALTECISPAVSVRGVSRYYKTPCFPVNIGPDYVNAVAVLSTTLDATSLLQHLHAIEQSFGRERKLRWGTRSLDLDLLAFGGAILPDLATYQHWNDLPIEAQMSEAPTELILPHPRISDRAFVLIPLADVAPDWCHPVTGDSVRRMLDALPEAEKSSVIAL